VIKTFADKRTAALFSGRFVKALPKDMAVRTKRKLDLIDSATSLDFLRVPTSGLRPAIGWRPCAAIEKGNTAFVSMNNGGCVFAGPRVTLTMLSSATIING